MIGIVVFGLGAFALGLFWEELGRMADADEHDA